MPLDFNVGMIIAAMIWALLCALGFNSMPQCVLYCSHQTLTEPVEWTSWCRLNSGLNKKDAVAFPTSTYAPASPSNSGAICVVDFLKAIVYGYFLSATIASLSLATIRGCSHTLPGPLAAFTSKSTACLPLLPC